MEAVIGSTAELPCITSGPHDDDAIQLILWYRTSDGTGPPFYTVDARSTDFVAKGSHKIVPNYLGRVFFSLSSPQSFSSSSISSSSEPSILSISPVREDDAGEYSCRVDYKWGRTSLSSQKLFVISKKLYFFSIPPHGSGKNFHHDAKKSIDPMAINISCGKSSSKLDLTIHLLLK